MSNAISVAHTPAKSSFRPPRLDGWRVVETTRANRGFPYETLFYSGPKNGLRDAKRELKRYYNDLRARGSISDFILGEIWSKRFDTNMSRSSRSRSRSKPKSRLSRGRSTRTKSIRRPVSRTKTRTSSREYNKRRSRTLSRNTRRQTRKR